MRDNKGKFTKGHKPNNIWGKGHVPWNKGVTGKQVAWNKGKTGLTSGFKGKISPMRGVPRSSETKKNISLSNTGKRRSDKARKNLSKSLSGKRKPWMAGENNPFWKGGITPINLSIRNSLDYRLWRKAVFERDNYTCTWCGIIGGELNADHIKPFSLFPKLRFSIDNGRTLCHSCHKKTPTYGKNNLNNIVAAGGQ